ncbi:hypothetical protein OQ968_01320 [Mycobacterium sp. 663a-19]|uniref:hypothetical protein n=1 Tax=Mycobacterium sp. 663a-19 TaxID=2986148 RepID=UPI002D1F17BB|nr:hypothetical protein [Mycobacterium sp. 663a-19]MEB3979899.1 hypothetical protein [Mycobacterium sp. 663a-19]
MWWFGRLAAVVAALFVSMAAAVAVPGTSSAACAPNMSFNQMTNECKLPPPPPAWYTPPPPYAPAYAPQDVPPPPPRPAWSPDAPMWSNRYHQWGVYVGGTWVPL